MVGDEFLTSLAGVCDHVSTIDEDRVAAGRDWWPLSVVWAVNGTLPALPAAVARPDTAAEVAAVLRLCHQAAVPVTVVAGASGVSGGSIPLFGGIALDLTRLDGIVGVDQPSLLVDVRAGTFGDSFQAALGADHHLTLGHWPQSVAISTVGGWLACRGAGQYSTRYGKIEDMVVGLEVALADGRLIRTGKPLRGRGRARPDSGVRRQRGDPRRHYRGPSASSSRTTGRAPRRVRLPGLRRRAGGLPAHPAPRRHPRRAPPVRPDRIGPSFLNR